MRRHTRQKVIALGLSLVFFSLAIAATPTSVRHTLHHSRHTATQHTTFVCAWMCAATVFVQSAAPAPEISPAPRLADLPLPAAAAIQAAPVAPSARAPPV